jgi:DNA-binding response OmpR family regulator
MKMLLVAAGDEHANVLAYHLKPLGFELERIGDPVRALNELDDMDPQAILFDAGDFPRHWKALLKLARERKSKEELIFVLISPRGGFDLEEAAKAVHLGVNGIIGGKLSDKQELYRLEELVRRYRSVRDKRNFTRLIPAEEDSLALAFTHPRRLSLVLGRIKEISIQGASFHPSAASVISDLPVGQEIPFCSLKVGEHLISVTCRLTRNREELGFQFLSFEEGGHGKLLRYIQSRPERALKHALAGQN